MAKDCIVCGEPIPNDHTCLHLNLHEYGKNYVAHITCEDGVQEALNKIDEEEND